MRRGAVREVAIVAAVAAGSLALRLVVALSMGIFQDEALYWWQAYEGLSFAPHPPMSQVMVRLGTALFGHTVLGLRAGSLAWGTAAIVMAYALARRMYGPRAGLWAAGLLSACPLFVAVGAVSGPNAPLLCLWLLFIYAAWRGAEDRSLAWWVGAGVALAMGLYTQYMMVLAVPSLGLALVASRRGRQVLKTTGPWAAVLVGGLLFAPVFLAWEWRHAWPATRYQLVARHIWELRGRLIASYVLWHVVAISPFLIAGVFWALGRWWPLRKRADWRGAWLASFGWVPIAFFSLPSMFTERITVRVQWDAVGYAAGVVAFALLVRERGVRGRVLRRRRRLAGSAVAVGAALTCAALVGVVCPGLAMRIGRKPASVRTMGWRDLAEHVRKAQASSEATPRFLLAESWRTAMCLGFHLRVREGIYTLWHERNLRYGVQEELDRLGMDEQRMLAEQIGRDALYVHEFHFSTHRGADDPPRRVYRFFSQVEQVGGFSVRLAGREVKHYGLFECSELRPPAPRPSRSAAP